jgi:cell division protein FtsL
MIYLLTISLSLSIWQLVIICVLSVALGFVIKKMNFAKVKKRVEELQNEMVRNHAKILKLEKTIDDLENKGSGRIIEISKGNTSSQQQVK